MIGYLAAASGAGMILGPALGAGLFYIGGYGFIYNGFGSSFILLSFFVKLVLGSEVDKTHA